MAPPARTDALDVIVELLRELDRDPGSGGPGFYESLCAALCNLAGMERAGLLLYDEARQLVVPVGSHRIEASLLENIYGTLEETPIAQVALSGPVVYVSGDLARDSRPLRRRFTGVTLTCTPSPPRALASGDLRRPRRGHFELTDEERHTMGPRKTAAWRRAAHRHGQQAARACEARIAGRESRSSGERGVSVGVGSEGTW